MNMYLELKSRLAEQIAGNENYLHHLCVLFDLYVKNLDSLARGTMAEERPRLNLFVTGPTGTGKTESIKIAAQIMGLYLHRIDCTTLSAEGWNGTNLSDHLRNFMRDSAQDGKHFNGVGVILLDEFDKLCSKTCTAGGGRPTEDTQHNMLDLLDGFTCPDALVIAAGSFQSLRLADSKASHIGFHKRGANTKQIDWVKRMVDEGIIPELANRFTDWAETEKLSKKEIKSVILAKKNSAFKKYQEILQGFDLKHYEIDHLVDAVHASDQGLRILNMEIYRLINRHYHRMFCEPIEKAKKERSNF